MKNSTITIIFICILCGFLISCSNDRVKPDYLIEGARDNGFVPVYRAYYAIDDENIRKISESQYEKYIYHNEYKYEYTPTICYSFNAFAKTKNPSEWEYEQSEYDDSIYNIDTLITYLSKMQTGYFSMPSALGEDKVDILVTEFDDYTIIEATLLDYKNTVKDSKCAIFHNGNMLTATEDLDLSSIRSIKNRSK